MMRAAAPMTSSRSDGRVRQEMAKDKEIDLVDRAAPKSVAIMAEAPNLNKLDSALQAMGPGQTVKVEIWLTATNPGLLAHLKQLGFVLVNSENGQRLIGHIPSAQLGALAQIEEVRFVKRAS